MKIDNRKKVFIILRTRVQFDFNVVIFRLFHWFDNFAHVVSEFVEECAII